MATIRIKDGYLHTKQTVHWKISSINMEDGTGWHIESKRHQNHWYMLFWCRCGYTKKCRMYYPKPISVNDRRKLIKCLNCPA